MFVWKQPYVVISWKCIPKKIKILKSIKRLTDSQMHRADKHSQDSSIIWPVWLNGWVFVYQLSGCGFESSSSKRVFEEFLFKIKMWSVCLQLYQMRSPSQVFFKDFVQVFGYFYKIRMTFFYEIQFNGCVGAD